MSWILKSMTALCEESGKVSAGRLISTIVTLWYLALSTAAFLKTHSIPDISYGWLTLALVPYSANKITALLNGRLGQR